VVDAVYYATPYSTVQLIGQALSRIERDGALIWTYVSQEMLRQTGAEDEASDDVVQVMQRVAGVRACILFKERASGDIKISLRSSPGIDVAAIARTWGGGGHTQAAGATLAMDLDAARREVVPAMQAALAEKP
jgi:phosphoesterase RecJ-like protein